MTDEEVEYRIRDWIDRNGLMTIIVVTCLLFAMASLVWLPKDNPIEQAAEKEIEIISGIHVDLTPQNFPKKLYSSRRLSESPAFFCVKLLYIELLKSTNESQISRF